MQEMKMTFVHDKKRISDGRSIEMLSCFRADTMNYNILSKATI